MKRTLLSATALALCALPVLAKAPPPYLPPPPLWAGFYVGLNAGYGWGATPGVNTVVTPLYDGFATDGNAVGAIIAALFGGTFSPLSVGSTSIANAGLANVNQNGFIGGGQVGYNHQWGSTSFVVGFEADIQGAGIRGSGGYAGGAARDAFVVNLTLRGILPISVNLDITRIAQGSGEITAGVDWLGTVRGRLGYLFTPTMLVYGTGGLAYGGVHASAVHSFGMQTADTFTITGLAPLVFTTVFPTFNGVGRYSNTRIGWTAGGGVEWMFMPNLSLKAEALYYDLGNVTLASSPVGALDTDGTLLVANAPVTRVKYDGVIARVGVNYHFNW